MKSDLFGAAATLVAAAAIDERMFASTYANVFEGNPAWNAIQVAEGDLFAFDESSTYIQDPPFFQDLTLDVPRVDDIRSARILAVLGDSVTTDHISPAGDIAEASPAGRHLRARDVPKSEFNSYGSRRGNDRVMVRDTFANIRLKNLMVPGVEGGVTIHFARLDSPVEVTYYRNGGILHTVLRKMLGG